MKVKGFTLIELLAVIVILAIIALIAVPIVLNIINNAAKSAFRNTAYGIVKAGELYYADKLLELEPITEDMVFTFPEAEGLEFDGKRPSSGTMTITKDGEISLSISDGKFCATKGFSHTEVTVTDGECQVYRTYQVGDLVKFDPGDGKSTTWYVIDDNENELTLILNKNLGDPIEWISEEDYKEANKDDNTTCESGVCNDEGPLTALEYLESLTAEWDNVPTMTYTLENYYSAEGEYTYPSLTRTNVKAKMLSNKMMEDMMMNAYATAIPQFSEENLRAYIIRNLDTINALATEMLETEVNLTTVEEIFELLEMPYSHYNLMMLVSAMMEEGIEPDYIDFESMDEDAISKSLAKLDCLNDNLDNNSSTSTPLGYWLSDTDPSAENLVDYSVYSGIDIQLGESADIGVRPVIIIPKAILDQDELNKEYNVLTNGQNFNTKIVELANNGASNTDNVENVGSTITTVEFYNNGDLPKGYTKEELTKLPSVDVSSYSDNSIMAYYAGEGIIYIYSDGQIMCNSNSSYMFNELSEVTTINLSDLDFSKVINTDYMFKQCSNLENVTLNNELLSIGEKAFYYCESLTSIEIPDSVISIGNDAFYRCNNLGNVTIGESVTSIGDRAFYECSSIESIELSDSVTSIGGRAFDGCSSLTSIKLPEGVTSIGGWTFERCSSLTSIVIPNSLITIPKSAFSGCSSLTTVTIGNNVTNIEEKAFYGCSSLTSIEIPSSVTSIGNSSFYGCSSLTSIEISNNVISIGDYAFYECSSLTSITIPDSVISIGSNAFYRCENLTTVTIGNSVTSIGNSAFERCSSLTSIELPSSVTSIGDYAFLFCTSLTSITIQDSVTSIGKYAFRGCSDLTSITIPSSVTSIGEYAFSDCSNLASIKVDENNTIYDSRDNSNAIIETATNTLIAGCKNTVIPSSVTSIGDGAFYGCENLTSIVIPNSVTSIGSNAFDNCESLTSITIPNSVTSIGDYAFYGCSSLTSIELPDSVTSIGYAAFRFCTSLTSITIPASVTSIEEEAFASCYKLASIKVDENNTVYDSRDNSNAIIETATNTLIAGCKNTVIPSSVTSIGNSAFSGCTGITSITIPSHITSIGEEAFSYCNNLTTVYFEHTTAPTFGDSCFYVSYKSEKTIFYFKNSTVANAFTTSYYNSSYGTKSTDYSW